MSERVGAIHYDVELNTATMIAGQREIDRAVGKAAQSFNLITTAVKLYAEALAAVKSINLADEMRLLAARVEIAAGSVEGGTKAFKELEAISRRTQTGIRETSQVFTRLNQSLVQMGGTQEDTLRLTELLSKAIKVSGASATEGKAAMLQFGQALGSGKLAGDELRSLLENAPYLMRQLADGIGVPIGALKQLGEDGKLTSDVVVNALSKAAARIDADFQKVPQTFSNAITAMENAALRANEALDNLTGTSAAATGAAKGFAEVLDNLARQFAGAATEADKLGRNTMVETWARGTVTALSYLADAADLVWQTLSVLGRNVAFVFQGVGSEIGGIGAQAVAVLRGDFAAARAIGEEMKRDADQRRRELDAADASSLKGRLLAGQRIRRDMAALDSTPGQDRLDRLAQGRGAPSKIRPPKSPKKAAKRQKFDAEGYLAGLESKTVEGLARINALEQEALRKNSELLKAKKITAAEAARAVTLIESEAARERLDIQLGFAEDIRSAIEQAGKDEAQAREKLAKDQAEGRKFAGEVLTGGDEIAQVEAELQRKTALLLQYAAQDQANADIYAAARVSLEEQTYAKIAEIQKKNRDQEAAANSAVLQNYSGLFGGIADVTKAFAGEQSSAYKAMFAVSKAFAIADALIKIQQGIAAASTLVWPLNIAAMASTAAATAGLVSTIQGTNFGGGRQYGGPASAGSMYRINETGRPEMFTAANGAQYMLPTASGDVTPANEVGGGKVQWQIIINNAPAGTSASVDQEARIVHIAVAEVANQVGNNSGQVWSAFRGSTNIQGRL